MDEQNENKRSNFNEASLKMIRINEYQSLLNHYAVNPLEYFAEEKKYGYEIQFTQLLNLLSEGWGKLTTDEKKEGKRYRSLIIDFLEVCPVHKRVTSYGYGSPTQSSIVEKKNWDILKELLFQFQMWLMEVYEAHELSTPNKEFEDIDFEED